MKYTSWLLFWVWIPMAIIWILYWRDLVKYKKTLFISLILAIIFAYPWDYLAVKYKIWYFPPGNYSGIWFAGVPVEEHIFITFVTIYIASLALVLHSKWRHL